MNTHEFMDAQIERSTQGAVKATRQFPIKLVQTTAGKMTVRVFDPAHGVDPLAAMAVRFEQTGVNQNPRHRAELQGAPIYHGLVGPMWDGDCIRYEDQETYNTLST